MKVLEQRTRRLLPSEKALNDYVAKNQKQYDFNMAYYGEVFIRYNPNTGEIKEMIDADEILISRKK
jgi:hypothetical protein